MIASTVEGSFRASAVDQGPTREIDPNKHGLKREYVAKRCIKAVDTCQRTLFLPFWYSRLGHLVYWVIPSVIEWAARRKYNF
jgi:short-subunit dehydrogenase